MLLKGIKSISKLRSWPQYTLTGLFHWLQPATIAEIWQDAETTTLILFYMDVMESVAVGLDADNTFIPHTKGAVLDWWLEATWAQWTSFSSWNQFEMTWALWHGSNNSMQWSLTLKHWSPALTQAWRIHFCNKTLTLAIFGEL